MVFVQNFERYYFLIRNFTPSFVLGGLAMAIPTAVGVATKAGAILKEAEWTLPKAAKVAKAKVVVAKGVAAKGAMAGGTLAQAAMALR